MNHAANTSTLRRWRAHAGPGYALLVGSAVPMTRRAAPAGAQRDIRFRRDVQRLHALGPRAIYEMLSELAAKRLLRTEIEQLVSYYAGLNSQVARATGADRLPPLPALRLVRP